MTSCNDCPSESLSLEDSRVPRFRRVLWVALVVNLVIFVVEITASYWADSIALQADALDFFGDSVNYAISLFVLGMSLQRRAYAALFKGLTMGAFGLWVIFNAIERMFSGSSPDPMTMGAVATAALIANVCVALLLYAYRSGDSNMRSIWLCSRNDAIGNVAVMLAATGVLTMGSHWPDLLVAGLIAGLSLSAAVQVIRQARSELKNPEPASASYAK